MINATQAGLECPLGNFVIDPWRPVKTALITHAHGDHARSGSEIYHAAESCMPLLYDRLGPDTKVIPHKFGEVFRLGEVNVSFHSAGHILGSSQVRVEGKPGVWLFTGDFKRQADPSCDPYEVVECDTFITESTFALPIYNWPETSVVAREILDWWDENARAKKASVLLCYSLGKAQRILAELKLALGKDRTIFIHRSMERLLVTYRKAGIDMLSTEAVVDRPKGSFAGELIMAPPSAAGSTFMNRIGDYSTAFASGWMAVRGARRRRGHDRGFVVSDHADWKALLDTCADTKARQVLCTHGYSDALVRYLQEERGLKAGSLHTHFESEGGED